MLMCLAFALKLPVYSGFSIRLTYLWSVHVKRKWLEGEHALSVYVMIKH